MYIQGYVCIAIFQLNIQVTLCDSYSYASKCSHTHRVITYVSGSAVNATLDSNQSTAYADKSE